ncbi:MAG: metal ABC transporter ATP-binding protein [Lachnospiraceae bacterium]|nr:metal ABC transporter ATP-binding protein [Lachnospiraceae bacterium]
MSLLSCQNLSFSYDGREVLSEINFSVEQGDYLCIVGENGAGKSTLIKGLLNLKEPSKGQILTGDGLKQNEIGYLPQQTQIQKDFPASVYEVVVSGRLNNLKYRIFYNKEDKRIALEKMEKLGILPLKNCCYRELSGGQQQRVLLARALLATRKLLLLDEPITGLDPIMSQEFYRIIREINQKDRITVVMVSHDVKGVISETSHILHVDQKQRFFGTSSEYQNSPLGKYFLEGGRQN